MTKPVRDPVILIARGGAIGDVILTLPVFQALRDRWPGATIELIAYPHMADLVRMSGLVNRVQSLDAADMARFFSLDWNLTDEQVAYVRSFDFIISYLYDPAGTVVDHMTAAGATHVMYRSPRVESEHAVEHLLKPLEELALYPEGGERPRLFLDDAARAFGRERVRAWGPCVMACHPGSGSPTKNWPLKKFLALAQRVKAEHDWTPLFLFGEADRETQEAFEAARTGWPSLSNVTLAELASVLAACGLYVGNDSGVTHLAAALDVPLVALFGPSLPERWGPRGPAVQIVQSDEASTESLQAVPVASVFNAVSGLMGR